MIDPPNGSGSRTILVPKVRTDENFVFLLLTLNDDDDKGPLPAFRRPVARSLRPNDGVQRWR
jgi:hypothetical protein